MHALLLRRLLGSKALEDWRSSLSSSPVLIFPGCTSRTSSRFWMGPCCPGRVRRGLAPPRALLSSSPSWGGITTALMLGVFCRQRLPLKPVKTLLWFFTGLWKKGSPKISCTSGSSLFLFNLPLPSGSVSEGDTSVVWAGGVPCRMVTHLILTQPTWGWVSWLRFW